MKLAVLADLHFTNTLGSPKQMALSWAMERIRQIQPDAVVTIGDMTATGKAEQASVVLNALQGTNLPHYATPGNAEYRSNNQSCVETFTIDAALPLLLINSAQQSIHQSDLSKITELPPGSNTLLATHTPVSQWPQEQQKLVRQAQERRAISAIIAGHSHHDSEFTMRGLDPDKASGGVPAFEVFEQLPDGNWSRTKEEMSGVDPREWTEEQRIAFRNCFGVSCMHNCLANLHLAVELKIPAIELRAHTIFETDSIALADAISTWRKNTPNGILSLHATDLTVEDNSFLEKSVEAAIRLDCQRVTLHVPAVTAKRFPAVQEKLTDNFLRICSSLLQRNIAVGIENLHTRPPHELSDDTRNYGCSIAECENWIQHLQQAANSTLIGFHLDIGHARNNIPFSSEEYVSDWCTQLGSLINGIHLHQVRLKNDGSFKNHCKLTGFYTKLISLSGLFLAYRHNIISQNTPMFLEINENDAGIECWKSLTSPLK